MKKTLEDWIYLANKKHKYLDKENIDRILETKINKMYISYEKL